MTQPKKRKGFVDKHDQHTQLEPAPHEHPEYMPRVNTATEDNIAVFDNEGNVVDSGVGLDSMQAAAEYIRYNRNNNVQSEVRCEGNNVLLKVKDGDTYKRANIVPANMDNLNRALSNPDTEPTEDSDALITSGVVYDALQSVDMSGKADKVPSATADNFAAFDENGNLQDSGLNGDSFAAADHNHDEDYAAIDHDHGDEYAPANHEHSQYLTAHQDISGKADKASNPTAGHLASLDSNGNPVDSGIDPSSLQPAGDHIKKEVDGVVKSKVECKSGNTVTISILDNTTLKEANINPDTMPNLQRALSNPDQEPTEDSDALITSDAVYEALADKADKIIPAAADNFAALDANGNLIDSGNKASDFAAATHYHSVLKGNANWSTSIMVQEPTGSPGNIQFIILKNGSTRDTMITYDNIVNFKRALNDPFSTFDIIKVTIAKDGSDFHYEQNYIQDLLSHAGSTNWEGLVLVEMLQKNGSNNYVNVGNCLGYAYISGTIVTISVGTAKFSVNTASSPTTWSRTILSDFFSI